VKILAKSTTRSRKKTAAPGKKRAAAAKAALSGGSPDNRRALGFIAALAGCGFTVLSLASYSATDPAFSRRSSVEQIENWCGRWGALEADLLLQLQGWTAWVVLPLALWIWLRFARRPEASAGRLVALAFAAWWSGTFLGLLFHPDALGAYPRGGVVGTATASWLLVHVGTVGSYVLVLALMVGAVTVLFNVHWEKIARLGVSSFESNGPLVQSAVARGLGSVRERLGETLAGWRERRAERADERARMAEDHRPLEDPASEGPVPALAIPIDADLEPVVDMEFELGLTGVSFEAEAPVPTENPTQVQRRELVEVEYDPDDLGDTPATPVLGKNEDEGSAYDVAPARRGTTTRPTMPPYVEEQEMGDGAIYQEPAKRPSGLDPVEPRYVSPVETKELPPEPSPTLEPEDEEETPPAILPSPSPAQASGPAVLPGNLVSGGDETPPALIVRECEPQISWEMPGLGLLDVHDRSVGVLDEQVLKDLAQALVQKLGDFGVRGEVTAIRPGPVITIFEYLPAPGVKVSRIAGLTDDIAMAMRALRVRIVAPIPGKGVVGIEIPNKKRQTVWLRDILVSRQFRVATPGAGEEHRRSHSYCGTDEDASSAGGRNHRIGQERGYKRHAPDDALLLQS